MGVGGQCHALASLVKRCSIVWGGMGWRSG